MDLDILVVGMIVVFVVLAIIFVSIELMHFIITRIETGREARKLYKEKLAEQAKH